ncbi:MAG: hypothetical protein ABI640_21170 [Gammaproteobacteria bacterium]
MRIGVDEIHDIPDQRVDVGHFQAHVLFPDESAQILDDAAGAQRFLVDLPADVDQCRHSGLITLENAPGCLSIGGNRAQRLVDLVRNTGGHLAHQIEATDVTQASLERARAQLRRPLARKIADDADETTVVPIAHFADRQCERKDFSVGTSSDDIASDADDARLSHSEVALDVAPMPRVVGLGHQGFHRLADDVGRHVSEEAFGRRIECPDGTLRIDHNDRIDRGIEKSL